MSIRLIRWVVFSLIIGLLPLGIKAGILYLCGVTIGYNDVYSEIIFFDLILNVGVINECISMEKHKIIQMLLISMGLITTVVLAVIFTILIMISYQYKINLDFKRMVVPTVTLSFLSVILSFSTQVMMEVEK
jgi:hypothetical protein